MELWRRVNKIAEQLGLGMWHLDIIEQPDLGGPEYCFADIHVDDLEARITFYKAYFEADSFLQLHVIVHELMHCVFAQLDDAVEGLPDMITHLVEHDNVEVRRALAEMLCETFEAEFARRAERLTDQVARIVVLLNESGGLV